MRLDRFISGCGFASRSEAKKLIKQGIVSVDGVTAKSADMNVSEDAVVCVGQTELRYRKYVYLMLNKPAGYVSAVRDKRYPAVTELIGEEYAHFNVFPAGRLDRNTEGLLILTNDGLFAHELTAPSKNVYKRYFARLDNDAEKSDIEEFKKGMEFKDFTAKPAVFEITDNPREVYVEIAEGKFHQVKRMCARVGKNVLYLKRVSIGDLKLDEALKTGEIRELTEDELKMLRR